MAIEKRNIRNYKIKDSVYNKARARAKKEHTNLSSEIETFVTGYSEKNDKVNWVFKLHDKIKTAEGKFRCICADAETAVFAQIKGTRSHYTGSLFAYPNNKSLEDTIDFERI